MQTESLQVITALIKFYFPQVKRSWLQLKDFYLSHLALLPQRVEQHVLKVNNVPPPPPPHTHTMHHTHTTPCHATHHTPHHAMPHTTPYHTPYSMPCHTPRHTTHHAPRTTSLTCTTHTPHAPHTPHHSKVCVCNLQMLEELCRALASHPSPEVTSFWEELLSGPLTSVLQNYPERGNLSALACDILSTISPQTMDAIKVKQPHLWSTTFTVLIIPHNG